MFKRIISDREIATQTANLINRYNQQGTYYGEQYVLTHKDEYIIESFGDLVVGVIRIDKQGEIRTELRSLAVRQEFWGNGLAKKLINRAAEEIATPIIYARIWEWNVRSQKAFYACGFEDGRKYNEPQYKRGNENIFSFVKISPRWKNIVDKVLNSAYNSPERRQSCALMT
jgi:N-acetylglutamate synthase-like GNAT family acetyltransferase